MGILLMGITACDKEDETIRIGFSVGLIGQLADEGVSARNGFILATEHVNASGGIMGRQIETLILDDESNVDKGFDVADTFKKEGVNFVIGHLLSSLYPAIDYGMTEHDLVYVSPTMATGYMTDKDDNFFRVIGDTNLMAEGIGKMVLDQDISKLMIIYDHGNLGFSGRVKDVLVDTLDGMDISILAYEEGDDFETFANEMLAKEVEGVAMITSSVTTANILQQMKLKDIDIAKFTSTWALSSELIYKGGRATEGLYGVGFYDKDSQSPGFLEFTKSFKARFSEEPSHTSYFAYEATMLLVDAFERAGSFEKDDVLRALKSTGTYQGLSDMYMINSFGDAERPYVELQVIDGKMKRVE